MTRVFLFINIFGIVESYDALLAVVDNALRAVVGPAALRAALDTANMLDRVGRLDGEGLIELER